MSNSLRSKQGCWTCRLRKKKCDEARPHCSTCISLSITCYGFGTRPDWMDDGEKEKSIANGIKEVVKRTSRRRTATTQVPKSRTSTIILAPKPSNSSSENSSQSPKPNLELGTDSTMHHEPPREQADRTIQAESNTITTNSVPEDFHPLEHYDVATSGTIPISMDDSILLMHFLDNVFPLQYPMYTPEVLDGGRGWLLANLLQSKPLYYAVLAISSYHHRMIVLEKLDHPCQIAALIQQEKHLEVCLSLVNHYAKNSCPTNGLGIATCIVQLVFYELFNGHLDAWQPHLRAAITMYERAQEMSFARLGLSEKSRAIICEDRVVSKFDSIVSAEVANFRFLVGTLIWLDITSSITTGATPCLSGYHTHTISPQSQIRLERIMGCENWAMALIGRISMLHESKVKALELQGNLVCSEFERVLNDIRQEIQQHLARTSMENLSLSELQLIDSTTFITRIFAFMASIYLHLITFGFQNLEILDRAICKDKTLLNGLIPPNILPALLCPLFVIGTVIEEEDQPFFRDFFSSPSLTHPAFKHRERIVPILEEIWRRRVSTSLTWQDCLDLTSGLLLI